jgi:hypothetical protein
MISIVMAVIYVPACGVQVQNKAISLNSGTVASYPQTPSFNTESSTPAPPLPSATHKKPSPISKREPAARSNKVAITHHTMHASFISCVLASTLHVLSLRQDSSRVDIRVCMTYVWTRIRVRMQGHGHELTSIIAHPLARGRTSYGSIPQVRPNPFFVDAPVARSNPSASFLLSRHMISRCFFDPGSDPNGLGAGLGCMSCVLPHTSIRLFRLHMRCFLCEPRLAIYVRSFWKSAQLHLNTHDLIAPKTIVFQTQL